jgi:hypothetical protein
LYKSAAGSLLLFRFFIVILVFYCHSRESGNPLILAFSGLLLSQEWQIVIIYEGITLAPADYQPD